MIDLVYVGQTGNPNTFSLFAAGPTSRAHLRNKDGSEVLSWRPNFVKELEKHHYSGQVFIPESKHGGFCNDREKQINWEYDHLHMAKLIVFWVPRDLETLPGFTTNCEYGYWLRSGKILYGRPESAHKISYLDWMYKKETGLKPATSMSELVRQVLDWQKLYY